MTAATIAKLQPAGRIRLVLDVALALWVAVWVVLGIAIGTQVRGLRQLSATVTKVGAAVRTTGDAIASLDSVPLVGGQIADAARQVRDAGDSAIRSGRRSRRSVHQLSWMLALAIAVIPSVPVLGFYLPMRLAVERERRILRRAARIHWADPDFRRLLAERALVNLPYGRLVRIAPRPWEEVRAGRCEALAKAELERLGLRAQAAEDLVSSSR